MSAASRLVDPTHGLQSAPIEVAPFQAIAISRLAHELKAQGRDVIHMEFGQPSTGAPKGALAIAHHVLDHDGMGYLESAPLKQALSARYLAQNQAEIDPERILLTCGASPALVLALMSAFRPGQSVAFARPGYVAYRNNVAALHLKPVELPCGAETGFQLTARHIEDLVEVPDGLIIASPANPTGTIIPVQELKAICDVCAQRGIVVISDEIYHGLSYGPKTHSVLEFMDKALIVNSFSKYFSMAGWRLGWLVAPTNLLYAARARMGNLFLTPPSLAQHAGLAALACTHELDGHLATYRTNRELLLAALPAMGITALAPPDGAFYIYASIAHLNEDSMVLARQLLCDTGVAVAPGVDFDPVQGHQFLRFSFAVSTSQIREAITRMTKWFQSRSDSIMR